MVHWIVLLNTTALGCLGGGTGRFGEWMHSVVDESDTNSVRFRSVLALAVQERTKDLPKITFGLDFY